MLHKQCSIYLSLMPTLLILEELRLRQGTRLVTSAKETMSRGGTTRLADVQLWHKKDEKNGVLYDSIRCTQQIFPCGSVQLMYGLEFTNLIVIFVVLFITLSKARVALFCEQQFKRICCISSYDRQKKVHQPKGQRSLPYNLQS